jgi:general stress protein 26
MSIKSRADQELYKTFSHLASIISEIRIGMLTTQSEDGTLRSRPMLTADREFDGLLWFFSETECGKVQDIRGNREVNIAYARPEREQYVSVSGNAQIVKDARKAQKLWELDFERWLPKEKQREDLSLIKVSVHRAEYWDAHRMEMIQVGGVPVKLSVLRRDTEQTEHEEIHVSSESHFSR